VVIIIFKEVKKVKENLIANSISSNEKSCQGIFLVIISQRITPNEKISPC